MFREERTDIDISRLELTEFLDEIRGTEHESKGSLSVFASAQLRSDAA